MKTFDKFIKELQEDAPISYDSKEFGFISPDGKVYRGKPDELHATVARRLKFGGSQPDYRAIAAGLIRYAVGEKGEGTFQFIATPENKSALAKFVRKAPIFNKCYVDVMSKVGKTTARCTKSLEFPGPDEMIRGLRSITEEITEADDALNSDFDVSWIYHPDYGMFSNEGFATHERIENKHPYLHDMDATKGYASVYRDSKTVHIRSYFDKVPADAVAHIKSHFPQLRDYKFFIHDGKSLSSRISEDAYWATFYKDWGFIQPGGKLQKMKDQDVRSDGHEELAERLGYEDVEDAIRHGLVRYHVTKKDGTANFMLRDDPKARAAVSQFISKQVAGPVQIEIYDRACTHPIVTKTFDSPRIAALQVKNIHEAKESGAVPDFSGLESEERPEWDREGEGEIGEASIYSSYAKEWGFIQPGGKVVTAEYPSNHTMLAKKLKFKHEQDAIRHGLVRFVIGKDGEANLELLNVERAKKTAASWLRSTPIKGKVFVDFVTKGGGNAGSKTYDNSKAAQRIVTEPDVILDESPTVHWGVPIVAFSREWGFIKPDGSVLKGSDQMGHLGLARKLGFQSENDAIIKGYARYVVDPKQNVSLEIGMVSRGQAAAWLKSYPGIAGSIYLDILNNKGDVEKSEKFADRKQAAAYLDKLKTAEPIEEEMRVKEWGFVGPNNKIIKGEGKWSYENNNAHIDLAQSLNFDTVRDALLAGYVRYSISPERSVALELTPKATYTAIRYIQDYSHPDIPLFVDLLDDKASEEGPDSKFYSFSNAKEAVAKLRGLRESGDNMKYADFVAEVGRRKKTQEVKNLMNDFFNVYKKPDVPLEPFGRKSVIPDNPLSGEVPTDATVRNPYLAVQAKDASKMGDDGDPVDPPFVNPGV